MEEQLKTLYGSAMELAAAEPPVLVDLSDRSPRARVQPSALGVEEAQDVQIKPVQPKQPLRKKATASVTAEPARPRQRLSANDQKVLAYLKQVLDRRSWKPLTQVAIADGAGIPLHNVHCEDIPIYRREGPFPIRKLKCVVARVICDHV